MARKAEKKKKRQPEKGPREVEAEEVEQEEGAALHPRTKLWIARVALIVFALVLLLSFLDRAGVVGSVLERGLAPVFGVSRFLLPLLALIVAFGALRDIAQLRSSKMIVLGLALFYGGGTGLLSFLSLSGSQPWGGSFGTFIAKFLSSSVGDVAGGIILAGMVFIGLFLILNFPGERKEQKTGQETEVLPKATTSAFLEKPLAALKKLEIPFEERPLDGMASGTPEGKKGIIRPTDSSYSPPPLNLIDDESGQPQSGDIKAYANIIKRTLANFDIEVDMGEVKIGPTVTQYTLKPAEGVKLSRITALSNDLALALAAHPLRIEAPIPGRSLVGIEIPNRVAMIVRLKPLLATDQFRFAASPLTFVLGRDVSGEPMYASLERMPHLLIAGATGTGKTICLNSIILSLLYRNPPDYLRFMLIDPKRVEFPVYNEIPHLLTPVITDVQKTVNALRWAVTEMDRRFDLLAKANARDIALYNRHQGSRGEPLPYLVIIIDELADLMAARGREVEAGIVRLAQMARAVGIHLVVATQRPSVEVITGLIKANITSRIAFQVASQVDARTILDMAGAEKLLGRGDMLYQSAEISKPRRLQGAYVSEKEIKRVADFLREAKEPEYQENVLEFHPAAQEDLMEEEFFGQDDPLYEEAKRLVIQARKASSSYFQRRLRIGYARAARLIDLLEERGVVGPGDGAKPREVLIGTGSAREEENEFEEE